MSVVEEPKNKHSVKRKSEEACEGTSEFKRSQGGFTTTTITTNQQHEMETGEAKKPVLKYAVRDQGPFVVLFKGQKDNQINEHQIVKQLKEANIEFRKISRITKTSRQVVKVAVEDGIWANKIAEVKLPNVDVFIPQEYVFREIVVFDVPLFMSKEMIREDIEVKGASEIIQVERINRWNFDRKAEEATTRVKVTYRGNTIPKEVYICKVVQKCAIYVRKPLFCKTCFAFGHLKKWCEGPKSCTKCFTKHAEGDIACKEKMCRYCDGHHKTNSRDCPETKKQWNIARIMATERVTRKEAAEKLQEDVGGFPTLPKRPPGEGTAQQKLKEWQNPNSLANQITRNQIQERIINDLKQQSKNFDLFIQHLVTTMKKRQPMDPTWDEVTKEFEKIKNLNHGPTQSTSN